MNSWLYLLLALYLATQNSNYHIYSGLFFLSANFPNGLTTQVDEVRLWVTISVIGMDAIISRCMAYKHLSLKPWVAKYFSLQLQALAP